MFYATRLQAPVLKHGLVLCLNTGKKKQNKTKQDRKKQENKDKTNKTKKLLTLIVQENLF